MSYLGEKPAQTLAAPTSQYFNGDGSTVAFTLNRAVNVAEDLEVFVNNVQQEPGVGKSYTATGTTLTFDAAPSSGTANVYVVYRGLAEVTTRLEHDANAALAATTGTFSGAVSAASATVTGDLTVDTNTLYVDSTNNRVGIGTASPSTSLEVSGAGTIARLTGAGTNVYLRLGNSTDTGGYIAYDGTDLQLWSQSTERLRIDGSGRVTKPYQPAFSAYFSGNNNNTSTLAGGGGDIVFNATRFNTGSHYSTSTGRFTAPIYGVYNFSACSFAYNNGSISAGNTSALVLRINGTNTHVLSYQYYASTDSYPAMTGSVDVKLNAGDYVNLFTNIGIYTDASNTYCHFSGHLVG